MNTTYQLPGGSLMSTNQPSPRVPVHGAFLDAIRAVEVFVHANAAAITPLWAGIHPDGGVHLVFVKQGLASQAQRTHMSMYAAERDGFEVWTATGGVS